MTYTPFSNIFLELAAIRIRNSGLVLGNGQTKVQKSAEEIFQTLSQKRLTLTEVSLLPKYGLDQEVVDLFWRMYPSLYKKMIMEEALE
jgi:hypothetical protein